MDVRMIWLALGTFAIGVEGFVISTLLPGIATDTGVSFSQAGYLVFAYAVAYAVGGPLMSAATGRFERRGLLSATALVFAGAAALAAIAPNFGSLLAARVLIAVCAGLYAASAQAAAVALSPVEKRARSVSIVVAGTTMAVALGAPLGGLINGFAGWRGTYWAIAALGVVTAIAIYALLPSGIAGDRRSLRERLAVLSVPGIPTSLLSILLYMAGPFAAFVYLAPLTTRAIGLDISILPLVLLTFGIGAAIGNYVGGQAADRLGAKRTVVLATVANIAMLILLSVVTHLPQPVIVPVFFVFMLIWGVVGWSFPPAQASKIVAMAPQAAPLALSLNASALYLGTALGAIVGGLVLEHATIYDLGWVAALFPLAALGVLLAGQPRRVVAPRLG